MWYHVTVRRERDEFLIQAPAFGRSRYVENEEDIERAAHELVAQCGGAAKNFTIDLEWQLQAVPPIRSDFRSTG